MDPTRVLEASLTFVTALIEDGQAIHDGNGGGDLLNLALVPLAFQVDATKGHPENLQTRKLEIEAALASLAVPVV
jgi:hypothetical protein